MTGSEIKIGVLSRRAPIGQSADSGATIAHVGGLTRVLPALAEFANIDWSSLSTQNQIDLPKSYSFSKISGQDYRHSLNIFLTEVDEGQLHQSDWFCTHFIWPLLHDLPIPEHADVDLDLVFDSINKTCQTMADKCFDLSNQGYLVNDFQLSQVPIALKSLEPHKQISFFLHTPWPKAIPQNDFALKILKFLATGMLASDVIEFQTQQDLQAFVAFASDYLSTQPLGRKLIVNPVSVNVQDLVPMSWTHESPLNLDEEDISYVHIARSDPMKNTLVAIKSFTALVLEHKELAPKSYLDLFIVPSRQQWPEYQELLAEIGRCVDAGNAELSSLDYTPIRLHVGNDYQRASRALSRYDYLIVCSVADGMNLVVKEGATLNNRNGVIVSTPRVGAMAELGKFCVVASSVSVESVTRALQAATNIDAKSREAMSANLKLQITEFDASFWAESVIAKFKILEMA